jgi:hypothetical protein
MTESLRQFSPSRGENRVGLAVLSLSKDCLATLREGPVHTRHPLSQLRLSSFVAKTSYPSPLEGEGSGMENH